ncbi:MAG: hypothetical protein PUD63_12585, partial [Clostridia bacterium]|nr:hypothetical protein [Clostridia bacterium]
MNKKQKLTALALSLSLLTASSALASRNAPTSQFGFKGWPSRKNNGCVTQNAPHRPTGKPSASCTPAPTAMPTAAQTPKPTQEPLTTPTSKPTVEPTAQPTAAPTAAPTQAPTARPTATPKPVATTPPSNGDDYTTPSISV